MARRPKAPAFMMVYPGKGANPSSENDARADERRAAHERHVEDLVITTDFETGPDQIELPFETHAGPKWRELEGGEARTQGRRHLPGGAVEGLGAADASGK